jgi:hypothetical protein
MKTILGAFILSGVSLYAHGADQVWRYVDDKTGVVSYSNVQIKGMKGTKVEILVYPVSTSGKEASPGSSDPQPLPIPAEVLRQIQSNDGSAKPSGLPPLPGGLNSSLDKKQTGVTSHAEPIQEPVVDFKGSKPVSREPKWARETQVPAGQTPSWAKDPFER